MSHLFEELLDTRIDLRRNLELIRNAVVGGSQVVRIPVCEENRIAVRLLVGNLRREILREGWPGAPLEWVDIDCGNPLLQRPAGVVSLLEKVLRITEPIASQPGIEDRVVDVHGVIEGELALSESDFLGPDSGNPEAVSSHYLRKRTMRVFGNLIRRGPHEKRPVFSLQYPEQLPVTTWTWYWQEFWPQLAAMSSLRAPQLIHQQLTSSSGRHHLAPPGAEVSLEVKGSLNDEKERLYAEEDIATAILRLTGCVEGHARGVAREIVNVANGNLAHMYLGMTGRLATLEH